MTFVITEEKVEEIRDFLNSRNSLKIKDILSGLETLDEISLRGKLESFIRNKGRSSILHSEIRAILEETKLEEERMTEEETPESTTEDEKQEEEESEE